MSDLSIKIGLLGNSSVGKSCLIRRYIEDKYEDNFITTIGVDYYEKNVEVNNTIIKLIIQDTTGEERFRSISKNYYKNVDGIIFVFDVTNYDSFIDGIRYWLNECDNEIGEFKKILVGNKIDLCENMRAISKEKIEVFAESKQIKYYEVSAKKGINVDIIFKELIESILRDLPKKNENKNKKLQNKNNSNKKKCC